MTSRAFTAPVERRGRRFRIRLHELGHRLGPYDQLTFPFPNPPQRRSAVRFHDLHHVVTGYGTDPTGEAKISTWELRRGLCDLQWFVQAIVISGVLFGLLHSPRRMVAAWRSVTPGPTLFPHDLEVDYPAFLQQSVGELRQTLGIPKEGITSARRLHSGAPERAPILMRLQ